MGLLVTVVVGVGVRLGEDEVVEKVGGGDGGLEKGGVSGV